MKSIVEPAREIPVVREVDVCVLGGGPGGFTAAIQAARHGAKTLLVERYGFLGGMATAGMVGPILGLHEAKSDAPTVGGVTREFCEAMAAVGGAMPWDEAMRSWGLPFDVETYKLTADRICSDSGVELLLHSLAVAPIVQDDTVKGVVVENKSGRQAVLAKCFVDATGDADIAYRSGAECTKGRPADGKLMAMGNFFRMGGMDRITAEQRKAAGAIIDRAVQEGRFVAYNNAIGFHGSVLQADQTSVNVTRFAGDGTDVDDLTRGELYLRRQVWEIVNFWRENVPGLQECYLISTAPQIGVRETRQIVGEQRIVGADVVAGRKREDAVARCSYWIDIHCPRGLVREGVHLCYKKCAKRDCYMLTDHYDELPDELCPPDYFDIPYGALVPARLNNLLVSGRCISADHQAMSAARVMGSCMAIGEACGVAAAMAADRSIPPRKIDIQDLRRRLLDAGCVC